MSLFKGRSAIDVVVIILASMVAITILLATVGIIIARLIRPELDMTKGGEAVLSVITTIVGALVGFIGGRAVGRVEANGNGEPKK